MTISTAGGDIPGYALLIAADAPLRNGFPATKVLPQLAAVPPAHLVGTQQASAVQLANPDDPNTVLTHLRTAAAVDGPLLVYVAGHLQIETRQRMLHLSLARTTPRAIRYTAFPWHWLIAELAQRPPSKTTVLADLTAAPDVWQGIRTQQVSLAGTFTLYGTVQLHDRRHRPEPSYTQALVQHLRMSRQRSSTDLLQNQVASAAAVDHQTTVWLGRSHGTEESIPPAPPPPSDPLQDRAPPVAAVEHDPHRAVFEAAAAGRHGEAASLAAAWEQHALRTHGPESPDTVHWLEVQADLAKQAGESSRASALWIRAAIVRLTAGQSETSPDVVDAVDRAHHCWHAVTDPATARQLGIELLSLRTRVTGKIGARDDVQQRLSTLNNAARQ